MDNSDNSDSSGQDSADVFEIERIRQIIELMKEHDLSEVDLRQAEQRIRLRRGDEGQQAVFAPAPQQAMPAPTAPPPIPVASAAASSEEGDHIVYIRSPMVGTFYSKANPTAEPYVKIGDNVSQESTVCIIEAMKMFNEIQAEVSGKIVAVLVENEEPVDVNKPLFRVDKSQ